MTLLTIGMPLYNAEKYLEKSLDCILSQTWADFELIISDNASTDRTGEIVRKYSEVDDRIKVITQTQNIGGVENFRFVLEQAKGEFFIWRSYDDLSDERFLEELVLTLKAAPEAELAVGRVFHFDEGEGIEKAEENPYSGVPLENLSASQILNLSPAAWIYGMFRREPLLKSFSRVLENYPHVWAFDHLTLFPILFKKKIVANYKCSFYQMKTALSNAHYRPKTAREKFQVARDFFQVCMMGFKETKPGLIDRVFVPISLLRYTNRKTEKFTRILRMFLGLRKEK